jgi:hypothetical protein
MSPERISRSGLVQKNPDQSTEGADPRELGSGALLAAGFEKKPLLRVIREKCMDCCCGQAVEVRKCTATGCELWPYRMGSNPFAAHPGNTKNFSVRTDGISPAATVEVV